MGSMLPYIAAPWIRHGLLAEGRGDESNQDKFDASQTRHSKIMVADDNIAYVAGKNSWTTAGGMAQHPHKPPRCCKIQSHCVLCFFWDGYYRFWTWKTCMPFSSYSLPHTAASSSPQCWFFGYAAIPCRRFLIT